MILPSVLFSFNFTPDANRSSRNMSNTEDKVYFGEQLFKGNFKNTSAMHHEPNYLLKEGDVISIKIWGAYEFAGDIPIDQKGNIFIPKVGTAQLLGLRAGELQSELSGAIKDVFNNNVQVYATIQGFHPLSVFVSGSVNNVGLYDGFSTDSVLQFIDKAGGIIQGEGSYRHVCIIRNKRTLKRIDLYDFLLKGHTNSFRFKKGDVILVKPMKYFVEVDGDVSRPYIFELSNKSTSVASIMKYVLPKPGVNRFIHNKRIGDKEVTNSYSLSKASSIKLKRGDKVNFFSNQYVHSISVAIQGEHQGVRYVSVPKGTSVYDVLNKVRFSPLSNIKNTQIFRNSVAKVQKELLLTKLEDLEARALTTDSATPEEAAIRSKEAELIMQFVERAKQIKPKGQVILSKTEDLRHSILEDGDRIFIPKKTNVVIVQGEVNIPNALTYKPGANLSYYIDNCGGYTDRANKSKVLLVKANSRVIQYSDSFSLSSPSVEPGDSILILGKTDTKNLLLAKDITQILYQIAVGAAVVLKSF